MSRRGEAPSSESGARPVEEAIRYKLSNTGQKAIAAIAFVWQSGEEKNLVIQMPLDQPVGSGSEFRQGYATWSSVPSNFEIDYVLFEDGSEWGADRYGQSVFFENYFKGRLAAFETIASLLDNDLTDPILKLIEQHYTRGIDIPVTVTDAKVNASQAFAMGYNERVVLLELGDHRAKSIAAKAMARRTTTP